MSSYKLYILSLEDNCWYVGITERDVQVRFAEHDGRGDYPGAAFCEEHPPLLDGPAYWQDISGWVSGRAGGSSSSGPAAAQARAEDLERRVTAQLMLLVGVNRVRGGGGSDVVSSLDYGPGDLHFLAQKVAGPLGAPYNDAFRHLSRLLADEQAGLFPDADYFARAQPEVVYLDADWNVVWNGRCVRPGGLVASDSPLEPPASVPIGRTPDSTVARSGALRADLGSSARDTASEVDPDDLEDSSLSSEEEEEEEEEEDSASSAEDSASSDEDRASTEEDIASSEEDNLSEGNYSSDGDLPSDAEDSLSDDSANLNETRGRAQFSWSFPWR